MEKIAKIIQAFTYWPTYLTLKIFAHYQVEGQENLKGLENKSVIFVSNHTSYIDGTICAAAMPRNNWWHPRDFFPIRFLVAREYYEWRHPKNFPFPISLFTTAYVKMNGCVPVDRGKAGDLSVKLAEAIKVLKKGARLWIYPEGKITKDGNLQPGKRGAAYLHQATGAPIVPVGLKGTFKILSFPPLIGRKVKIRIGKPIHSLGGISLEEEMEKVMQEIAALIK